IEQKIEIFLHNVIKISARCPASLFATEKFESFNSVLRKASVHSNRHQPVRDLAVTFANYESMQAVLSRATLSLTHASNHPKFNGLQKIHHNELPS
ncbi:hypothetical protein VP01_14344g1, partial [Puccinia sorghi]